MQKISSVSFIICALAFAGCQAGPTNAPLTDESSSLKNAATSIGDSENTAVDEVEATSENMKPLAKNPDVDTENMETSDTSETSATPPEEEKVDCSTLVDLEQQQCLFKEALESKNPDLCENFSNTSFKYCDDYGYCPGGSRDSCYSTIAFSLRFPSLCNSIESEFEKNKCFEGLAGYLMDFSLCPYPEGDKWQEYCKRMVIFNVVFRTVKCEKEQSQQDCNILSVANKKVAVELCDELGSAEDRNTCVKDMAVKMVDPTYCKALEGEERIACVSLLGSYAESEDICEKIEETLHKENCYSHLAVQNTDIELCKKITGDSGYCYAGIAIKTKNKALCNEITSEAPKYYCLNN